MMRIWQLHGSDAADRRFHRRRCATKSNDAEGYDYEVIGSLKVARGFLAAHSRCTTETIVVTPAEAQGCPGKVHGQFSENPPEISRRKPPLFILSHRWPGGEGLSRQGPMPGPAPYG